MISFSADILTLWDKSSNNGSSLLLRVTNHLGGHRFLSKFAAVLPYHTTGLNHNASVTANEHYKCRVRDLCTFYIGCWSLEKWVLVWILHKNDDLNSYNLKQVNSVCISCSIHLEYYDNDYDAHLAWLWRATLRYALIMWKMHQIRCFSGNSHRQYQEKYKCINPYLLFCKINIINQT